MHTLNPYTYLRIPTSVSDIAFPFSVQLPAASNQPSLPLQEGGSYLFPEPNLKPSTPHAMQGADIVADLGPLLKKKGFSIDNKMFINISMGQVCSRAKRKQLVTC